MFCGINSMGGQRNKVGEEEKQQQQECDKARAQLRKRRCKARTMDGYLLA